MSIPRQELTLAADFKGFSGTKVVPATAQSSGAQLVWGQGKIPGVGVCKARGTDFPGVQWSGHHASTVDDVGSVLGWGVKIPPATQCSQKKARQSLLIGRWSS